MQVLVPVRGLVPERLWGLEQVQVQGLVPVRGLVREQQLSERGLWRHRIQRPL